MPQPKSGQDKPGRSKVEYPTPDHRDTVLSDALTSDLGDYLSLVAGTDHPDFVNRPDHRLLGQIPIDWQNVQRVYGKDRVGEQLYNAEIAYPEDSKAHPIFTRDFLVRRNGYLPATPLTSMSGLIRGNVTAAGSGYTQATVSAALSGGVGSGGTVTPIVSKSGTIIGLQITAVGHYTIPPALTISDSAGGAGATGELFIQPKTAVLTNQRILRMADSPLDSLYFISRRTYMTLPGPWVPFTRYDDNLGPIQGRRRTVKNEGQVPSLTATTKTTYEGYEGSSHVSYEIEETYTTGAGTENNPTFPIGLTDFYDDERGAVHQVSQIVANLSSVGTLTVAGGVATQTRYEPFNEFLRKKIIETWAVPTPLRTSTRVGEQGVTETTTRRIHDAGTVSVAGGYLVQADSVTALTAEYVLQERTTVPEWPTLTDYDQHPEHLGSIVTTLKIVDATAVSAPSTTAGKIKRYKHIDKWRSMEIEEDFTAFTSISYSEYRFMAHTFPALFNISGYAWSDDCGAFSDQRDSFSTMVKARLDVTFTTTVQTVSGLTLIPKSLHLGRGLQVSNVLVDACVACLTYSGTCTGTLSFTDSDPTRTAYLALVSGATPQLIQGESVRTPFGGLYKNSSLYILLK